MGMHPIRGRTLRDASLSTSGVDATLVW